MFNVQVPLPERNEVFLMNTFSDAQLLVSPDVTGLLDRMTRGENAFSPDDDDTIKSLVENGFIVDSRDDEQTSEHVLHGSPPDYDYGRRVLREPCHTRMQRSGGT